MFTGVMNLMMNTAIGRPAAPGAAAVAPRAAAAERLAVRVPSVPPRRRGSRPAPRATGLAPYQILAEAFKAATRAR